MRAISSEGQGAAVCRLEETGAGPIGARERAPLDAEHLRL
jgi:hypothetical protein